MVTTDDNLYLYTPFISAILWTSLYFFLKIYYQHEHENASHLVAGIHGLVASVLCLYVLWLGPNPYYYPGGPSTDLQEFAIGISLGYFFYDFSYCLAYSRDELFMLLHHVVTIIAITSTLMKRYSGIEACAGLVNLEITNPLLQLRWFMKFYGHKHTPLFKFIDFSFVIVFFICRILLGTLFVHNLLRHPRPGQDVKFFAVLLYLISWVFMVYMLQYCLNKYAGDTARHARSQRSTNDPTIHQRTNDPANGPTIPPTEEVQVSL